MSVDLTDPRVNEAVAVGLAVLAIVAFLAYGAMCGGRELCHHLATYNGAGEEQKPDEQCK